MELIFVVLGIEGLMVPIPEQQTMFCITLDNGIDYIRTPYTVLIDGAKVNQEFSLYVLLPLIAFKLIEIRVEHPNFEFSLSLDIRRDPHILKALHEKLNPIPAAPSSPAKSSIRTLFGSPRKPKPGRDSSRSSTPLPTPVSAQLDSIARYLATPGSSTIAKTHVAFKPIAKNCEAKILEIRYPMFAMFKGEPDRHAPGSPSMTGGGPRKQVAKITLQIMRLPAIPGMKADEMPQCIDDCLRGIRHHAWHEHEYHEGILTQEGGDCMVSHFSLGRSTSGADMMQHPRRRMFKLIGGNLVAINEVTKKEVASIDLCQVEGVVDLNANESSPRTARLRSSDEGMSVRPRSFQVDFAGGEGIVFSADKDEDKITW